MSAHTTKRLLLVGVTAEVVYRTMVRQRVRAYLGIEQEHRRSPVAANAAHLIAIRSTYALGRGGDHVRLTR